MEIVTERAPKPTFFVTKLAKCYKIVFVKSVA